jgi:hypothetical protein
MNNTAKKTTPKIVADLQSLIKQLEQDEWNIVGDAYVEWQQNLTAHQPFDLSTLQSLTDLHETFIKRAIQVQQETSSQLKKLRQSRQGIANYQDNS